MIKGISVIICCYNSVSRIKPTLEHIADQIFTQNILSEVILIDNNSDDEIVEYAQKIWDNLGTIIPIRIISESQPGLSFARDYGIKSAQYEYILFCDDDNWLAQNYLEFGYNFLESNKCVGILGGRGEVVSDIEIPYWFSDYQRDYAVGVQALSSQNLTSRGFIWGAGMFLRKSIYQRIKSTNIQSKLTDRKGKSLSSGGDTEISQWFIWADYELWYHEELMFKHFITKERLSKDYYLKLKSAQAKSYEVIGRYMAVTRHISKKSKEHFLKKSIRFFAYLVQLVFTNIPLTKRIQLEILKPFSRPTFDAITATLLNDYKRISKAFAND
jgi:glycosyltransferase involved in cell wall biosynthesis